MLTLREPQKKYDVDEHKSSQVRADDGVDHKDKWADEPNRSKNFIFLLLH